MNTLIHPTYFPNIAHFSAMVNADGLCFEVCDNYQKQTYRNRCDLLAANGKLALTVPVSYSQKQRQGYKDVKIANDGQWQSQHLKSIQSAYRMSPFYEFYEDELMPLFELKAKYILDFNLKCIAVLSECLQVELNYETSTEYKTAETNTIDFRPLVNLKDATHLNFRPYTQVFALKHGYLPNLSILDLLFNEGPNTLTYLEAQTLKL